MDSCTVDYQITDSTLLQFQNYNGSLFRPKIVRDSEARDVPLLISKEDIPEVIAILDNIVLRNDPVHYIANVVAGSVIITIKNKQRKD
jgi:hypothetical protein